MSTRIKLLSDAAINQIAAGEVVERPASVVKELVENSLDADAGRIRIIVNDGGKQLITVIDNGNGMNEDDACLSIRRHTTSKIETEHDLETVTSYGFRGEALASIAAVSILELKTKDTLSETVTGIEIRAGELIRKTRSAGNPGTSISVKNLFFNTPGRRKFLKTRQTELRHIAETVKRLALANCNVEFEFISDDATVWRLPPGTLKQRLIQIYGKEIENNIIEIGRRNGIFSLSGYIGSAELARTKKNDQLFFLNGRFVRNRTVSHAAHFGYRTTINEGSSPFYALFLETDPEFFDINVHPAKLEVKFENEQDVHRFISGTVKEKVLTTPAEFDSVASAAPEFQKFRSYFEKHETSQRAYSPSGADTTGQTIPMDIAFRSESMRQESGQDFCPPSQEKVWQIHNKYIVSQIKSGIFIIDQHAAHERILYEKSLRTFKEKKHSSQQLLFPQRVDLPREDMLVYEEIFPLLELLGFVLRSFGRDSIVVEAVPNDIRKGNVERIIKDIINEYKKDEYKSMDLYHRVASSVACRGAIMSGDGLSAQEMNELIDQLFATEHPFFCPHGRPTVVNLTLNDLDRMFGRIG